VSDKGVQGFVLAEGKAWCNSFERDSTTDSFVEIRERISLGSGLDRYKIACELRRTSRWLSRIFGTDDTNFVVVEGASFEKTDPKKQHTEWLEVQARLDGQTTSRATGAWLE